MLYVFGPDRAQRSIAFLTFWTCWPIGTSHYFFHSQFCRVCEQKPKDCSRSGSFQHMFSTLILADFHNQSPLLTMLWYIALSLFFFFLSFLFLLLCSLLLSWSFFLRSCAPPTFQEREKFNFQRAVSKMCVCFFPVCNSTGLVRISRVSYLCKDRCLPT